MKIKETFETSNMAAVIVPSGNYEAEAQILQELSQQPQVKSTISKGTAEAVP